MPYQTAEGKGKKEKKKFKQKQERITKGEVKKQTKQTGAQEPFLKSADEMQRM